MDNICTEKNCKLLYSTKCKYKLCGSHCNKGECTKHSKKKKKITPFKIDDYYNEDVEILQLLNIKLPEELSLYILQYLEEDEAYYCDWCKWWGTENPIFKMVMDRFVDYCETCGLCLCDQCSKVGEPEGYFKEHFAYNKINPYWSRCYIECIKCNPNSDSESDSS